MNLIKTCVFVLLQPETLDSMACIRRVLHGGNLDRHLLSDHLRGPKTETRKRSFFCKCKLGGAIGVSALQTMPTQLLDGIGPWTSHYFGMRILGWPDAFIASDLVVRKQLAPPLSVKPIEARSQVWRPWRAYAVMHLWHASGFFHSTQPEKI